MSLVIDASVAVTWVLDEVGSTAARRLLETDPDLRAPDLLLAEVANTLWRAVRKGGMTEPQARAAMTARALQLVRLTPAAALAEEALRLALARDHPAYDGFYVALARRESVPLVTADAKLARVFAADAEIRLLGP